MKTLSNITLLGILFVFPLIANGQGVGTSPSFRGPVGLQTYSLREQIAKEGAKVFDYVKEQGFKEVEIGLGNHYGMTREELRDTLKKHGIKPVAAHAGLDNILKKTDEIVKEADFFGIKYVGVAWVGHNAPLDEAQTLKIAEDFNAAGKLLKEHGIQFFYHNHGYEFQPYKGDQTLFDLLMEKTDPELVKYQMDVLWTVFPGQDPVKLLRKYPNRWVLMHLKDLRKGVEGNFSGGTDLKNDVPLGTGQTDYPALLKAAQEVGIKYYFIEDESPDVLKQIPQSLKYLSTVEF
ncbi:MAG: sugar phosphate isomerase/epimerase [Planctomycetaceae bacterium]|jgi:sugar phosphate isomerase/epimerase|nr:sugar phosphate isomerase/epimerase [Planctomycetaceae bacterium]